MQFRLGSFRVEPLGSLLQELLQVLADHHLRGGTAHRHPPGTNELDPRLHLALSVDEARRRETESSEAPCLLERLPPGSPERGWLGETHEAMQETASGRARIQLDACDAEPGPRRPIVVSFCARGVSTDVRQGDTVCAGVALRADPDGGLQLSPRVYRVRCANGLVSESGTLAVREATPGAIRAAVRELLGRRVLEEQVEPLRAAAALPVDEATVQREIALFARLVQATALHSLELREAQMRAEYERAGDRTAWGLVNALTAVARSQRDWSRRLREEREAGGVLARLLGRQPRRSVGVALDPPRVAEFTAAHA